MQLSKHDPRYQYPGLPLPVPASPHPPLTSRLPPTHRCSKAPSPSVPRSCWRQPSAQWLRQWRAPWTGAWLRPVLPRQSQLAGCPSHAGPWCPLTSMMWRAWCTELALQPTWPGAGLGRRSVAGRSRRRVSKRTRVGCGAGGEGVEAGRGQGMGGAGGGQGGAGSGQGARNTGAGRAKEWEGVE